MELNLKNSLCAVDFAGKVAIFDMDGVLMPFRYNGRIQPIDGAYHIQPDEFNAGIIEQSVPSKHLQDVVSSIDAVECLATANVVYNEEFEKRTEWLHEHYPRVKDLLICQNGRTTVAAIEDRMESYQWQKLGITKEKIIIICANVNQLSYLETCGYDAWHVSSIMDFYKQS